MSKRTKAMRRIIALLCVLVTGAFAQKVYYEGTAKTVRAGNLAPVPFADIYVCSSSATGTPCSPQITVYSDQAGTPITQPIVADAYGHYSFYAAPGAVIQTISGRGIVSENFPITLPPACDGNGNCSAKSIEQVRYADQFAGAGIGAKLTAAIADLGVGGGTVIVPRGSYTLSAPVVITQPNICIVGQGSQATSITSTVNGDAFKWDVGGVDPATPLQNGCLEGLTIYGNSQANATGVHIEDTTGLVLRDVALMNFTGTSGTGVYLDNEVAWTERTVFDHVTTQNNTYSYYFYKGASTSGSFGYTSWLASHMQVNNGQVGLYIASGADLYHSTLDFKANLQPFNNGSVSKLIEVAGNAVENSCTITGEFTGNGTGSGSNYGIVTDGASQFSCSGFVDVATATNSGAVFVGVTEEDGAHSTLFGTLPDGTTTAWPIAIDRADTSFSNTHPLLGLAEDNGLSKAAIVGDMHNCINDGRCGVFMYNSSGSTPPWLAGASLWGAWTNDGAFRTSGPIQGFGTASSASSGFLLNWNETAGQGEIDIDDLFRAVQNASPGFQFNVYDAGGTKRTVVTFDRTGSITANGATFASAVTLNGGGSIASGQTLTNSGTIAGGTVNATTLQQGGVNAALQGVDINSSNQVTATHSATLNGATAVVAAGRFKLADQGQCTMASGTCAAQALGSTYTSAPICIATWTGTGTLTGPIKIASTTTTVTPSSATGTDTAQVNWACVGN